MTEGQLYLVISPGGGPLLLQRLANRGTSLQDLPYRPPPPVLPKCITPL